MNSKQRRRETKRLRENSQYYMLPRSTIDVKQDVLRRMANDFKSSRKKRRQASSASKETEKAGATIDASRSGSFVMGINAVTRALERGALELVVISGRANPLFVQHLPLLCSHKDCKWSTIADMSCETLGGFFDIKRLAAFGLRRRVSLTSSKSQKHGRAQPILLNTPKRRKL